jgi:hypothetical protein
MRRTRMRREAVLETLDHALELTNNIQVPTYKRMTERRAA